MVPLISHLPLCKRIRGVERNTVSLANELFEKSRYNTV